MLLIYHCSSFLTCSTGTLNNLLHTHTHTLFNKFVLRQYVCVFLCVYIYLKGLVYKQFFYSLTPDVTYICLTTCRK